MSDEFEIEWETPRGSSYGRVGKVLEACAARPGEWAIYRRNATQGSYHHAIRESAARRGLVAEVTQRRGPDDEPGRATVYVRVVDTNGQRPS